MPKKKNSKIDETLKRLAAGTSKASTQISSNTEARIENGSDTPGDPDCPFCHGLGYLREDLPIGHPEFGKVQICTCRQAQVSQHVRQRLFKLSHLDELSHHTFDTFDPQGRVGLWPKHAESLEYAYNQSKQFARKLDGWLVLHGAYGCGKTHLAAAIANFAVEMGVPTLFITVPDLLDSLRFTYQNPEATFEERFNEIRTAPLLVLDDFGTQNATPWAQEKLFQIINYRYINKLPTVVTTNLPLEEIEGRIRSRLDDRDWVTVASIAAPDFRNPVKNYGEPELSSLHLHHERTFGNFDLRKEEGIPKTDLQTLEKAFQAAVRFAENPKGWLVYMGTYGTGKTHLAAAIGLYWVEKIFQPYFVVVPDLFDYLRATFSPNSSVSLDRRFEEVRKAQLLILDDLGTQSASPWVKEKLYQLFNYRYNAELPTVITTTNSLEEMDPRIRSRMLDRRLCEIFAITVPPYTGIKK